MIIVRRPRHAMFFEWWRIDDAGAVDAFGADGGGDLLALLKPYATEITVDDLATYAGTPHYEQMTREPEDAIYWRVDDAAMPRDEAG